MEKTLAMILLSVMILGVMLTGLEAAPSPTGSSTTSWRVEDVPNPLTHPGACGVEYDIPPSYVCNPNRIIANMTVISINNLISLTSNDTKSRCANGPVEGYKVAVLVVEDIFNTDGLSPEQQRAVADNFATTLRDTSWKFGACNNSVVIVLSSKGNTIGISLGERASGKMTKEKVKEIVDLSLSRLNGRTIGAEALWIVSKLHDNLTDAMLQWESYRIFLMVFGGILGGAIVLLLIYLISYACVNVGNSGKKRYQRKMARINSYDKANARNKI